MDSIIIKLIHPIPIPSIIPEQVTHTDELVIKNRITLLDMSKMRIYPGMETSLQLRQMIKALLIKSIPDTSLDHLDMRDQTRISEIIGKMMGNKQ